MAPFGFDDVVAGKLSASRVGDSLYGDEATETRAWAKEHVQRNRGRHVATTQKVR